VKATSVSVRLRIFLFAFKIPNKMKKKLKPVEGSADEDIREIEEADQIRLRAISTIQALLNA